MYIAELHKVLQELEIPSDSYYLHGLYGSTDDNEKLALSVKQGKYSTEFEVYFRERGEKHSTRTFIIEDEACQHFLKSIKESKTIERILKIDGLSGMTVNERLYASGLMQEFDKCRKENKSRAKQILKWLKVNEASTKEIIK